MAGLPKKYAKMGFKKGWAMFKKSKKSTKAAKRTTRTARVKTMAKRKTYKKKSKVAKAGNSFMNKLISKALPVAYGYAREPLSDALANSPLGKALPNLGKFGDEITILGLNYGATALGARKNPMVRKALQVIEIQELGSVGREFYESRKSKSQDTEFDF